jgi:hypothetical protein
MFAVTIMHEPHPHIDPQPHLDSRLIWCRRNVLWPVTLQADSPGLLWLRGLSLDIDGLAFSLSLLLSSRVLLDSEDELFSAAAVADVLLPC